MSPPFGPDDAPPARAQPGLRLLDEAVRLLDLLQAPQPPRASASRPDADGEVPHRGENCHFCPICRGLAALREANPEAVARMTRAVTDLASAVGDLVAGPDRADPRAPAREADGPNRWYATDERQPAPRVQWIDVTD